MRSASISSVGDAYDNALMESTIGLFKTELIKPQRPWKTLSPGADAHSQSQPEPRRTYAVTALLVEQHATGEHSIADLAELFSANRATVYRVLERARIGP